MTMTGPHAIAKQHEIGLLMLMLMACAARDTASGNKRRDADDSVEVPRGGSEPKSADLAATTSPDASPSATDGGLVEDATAPSDPDGAARTPLISSERWTVLDAAEDPFGDRPDVVDCAVTAVGPELLGTERVLGINTGACNYVTVIQPILRAVQPGETIKVRLWHFELDAPEPAEAHVAVFIDGVALLEQRVAIPQPGGLITQSVRADRVWKVGAPAVLHLHNHGANSWALVELSVGP
jgi:hypothetical protein